MAKTHTQKLFDTPLFKSLKAGKPFMAKILSIRRKTLLSLLIQTIKSSESHVTDYLLLTSWSVHMLVRPLAGMDNNYQSTPVRRDIRK